MNCAAVVRFRSQSKDASRIFPGGLTRLMFGLKGHWCYLYRAIDSCGATIEFFLSAFGDLDAAKSLFRRALRDGAHRQPRVINTDVAPPTQQRFPTFSGRELSACAAGIRGAIPE